MRKVMAVRVTGRFRSLTLDGNGSWDGFSLESLLRNVSGIVERNAWS
jgi:hypothetical protein